MILIRPGCFETNSSSCHAFTMASVEQGEVLETIYPNEQGTITLKGGQYGRGFHRYNDALEKANYLATQTLYNEGLAEVLIDVIKRQTLAKEVVIDLKGDRFSEPYVDHESVGNVPDGPDAIRKFIFDRNSWLLIKDSEYRPAQTFEHFPVFKQDGQVEVPTYHYRLSIDGFEDTVPLKKGYTAEDVRAGLSFIASDQVFSISGKLVSRWGNNFATWDEFFEYWEYRKQPDLENNIIYFTRDAGYKARQLFDTKHGTGQEIDKKIDKAEAWEKERYDTKDPDYVKAVKFNIIKAHFTPSLDELSYYRHNYG